MSEWRILGPEEVIQEGDEIASRDVNNWFKCCTSIAGTAKDNSFDGAFQFRRRVSPAEQSSVVPRHKANCQLIRADNLINHDSRCLWLITRKDCKCKKCTCGLSDLQDKLKELEGV